ncbi:hypothetical protein CCP3SC1_190047 [Gammaproteobacteria bacterium]
MLIAVSAFANIDAVNINTTITILLFIINFLFSNAWVGLSTDIHSAPFT